jgi:protein TonB
MTFMVPLVAPPPGWEPPKPPEIKVVPIEFAPEMTAPKLVAGAPGPAYPQKARDMCVEGKAVARCTITEEGELTDCYMVKSLPGVDEAILTALAGRRYTPVLYKGKPQRVFYTFPFTFKLE